MLREDYRKAQEVYSWRRWCLLRMGCSRPYARILAESDADLHQMLALLRHGASADEVLRILL